MTQPENIREPVPSLSRCVHHRGPRSPARRGGPVGVPWRRCALALMPNS